MDGATTVLQATPGPYLTIGTHTNSQFSGISRFNDPIEESTIRANLPLCNALITGITPEWLIATLIPTTAVVAGDGSL